MITLLYGNHGCGKSDYVFSRLREDAEAGRKALLIMPEQMNVTAERRLAYYLPAAAQLNIEATSFTRLCNTVFRKRGGLSDKYANDGIRSVIMSRALRQTAPLLAEYSDSAKTDRNLAGLMLALADEFAACGISCEQLDAAAQTLKNESARRKLGDISTVISAYRALLHERFDDPRDDLARLAEIEDPESLFGDVNVYIDSFSGLTGVQHAIIRMLMNSAANVTVSIPLSGPADRGPDKESLVRMSDKLRRDAAASGKSNKTEILVTATRFRSPLIANVASELWADVPAKTSKDKYDGSIRLINAQDNYDEAEACAAEIRKLVREGYRYSDIAVVARSADKLRGIIDRTLEDCNIPCFMSEKTPLSSTAAARLLLSALAVIGNGWQARDVIAHVKTGLCGIDDAQCDAFELYCEKWRINSAGFLRGEWNMNPDGYVEKLSDRGKATLETVNGVRKQLTDRLTELNDSIKGAATCADICAALYNYMEALDVKGQLYSRALREQANGHGREANECSRVYAETLRALENLSDAYGDAAVPSLSDFISDLKTVFDSVYMGSIPASCDAVVIGSADMLRADSPKCVILLGVYDGSFPQVPNENGLLSAAERKAVCKELELSRDTSTAASDELYYVRRSMAFASEKLIVFTRQTESSVTVSRLISMTEGLAAEKSDGSLCDRICSQVLAEEYSALLEGTPEGNAIRRIAAEKGFDTPADRLRDNPVGSSDLSLSALSAQAALGTDMVLSQSKLNSFLDCPFKFYCRYILKLDPSERADFNQASFGTFVHGILEKYLREIYTSRGGVFPDDEGRRAILENIVRDSIDRIAPEESGQRTARLTHLSNRLVFLADVITSDIQKELTDSDFVPKEFELKIGRDGIPPLSFPLKSGGKVSLEGTIDRVDVYEKDGKTYVRCVDYKTGSKDFKLEDVEKGENLQLLLYLFSLTRKKTSLPGVASDGLSEGAFTYLSTNTPRVDKNIDDEEGIKNDTALGFSRSGAILDDADVIQAVSHSGDKRYLMGSEKTREVLTPEKFDGLFSTVSDTLVKAAEEMKGGKAAARSAKGADTCKYCEYAEVCRNAVKK